MILLFLFAFLLRSSFLLSAATTRAACDPVLAIDPLEQRSRSSLERISAIVDGRIRFNQVILDMLKDEETSIEERLFEYWKNYGLSEKDIAQKIALITGEQFLARTIAGVKGEIQTLTTTQAICSLSEKGKYDPLKSGFFLALNIYSSIAPLKAHKPKLSKSKKLSLDSSNYSELPHYKKMLKHLKTTNLPNLYDLMEGMFIQGSGTELQYRYNHDTLSGIREKICKICKQVKDPLTEHNEELRKYHPAIAYYGESYIEIENKLCEIAESIGKIQVSWQNFGSLKNFFDKVFWPEMECEMSLRDLESQIDSTTQKLKKTKEEKPKDKPVSAALSVSHASSNTAESSMEPSDLVKSATTILSVVPTSLVSRTDHPPYVADLAMGSSGLDTALYVSSASVFNTAAPKKKEEKSRFYKVITQPKENKSRAYKVITQPKENKSRAYKVITQPKEEKSRAVSLVGEMQEWMGNLKKGKQVKFDNMLKAFEEYLGAEIEQSQLTEITFRGHNQKLTKIFCHKPHGSQLKKAWPAWRYHMIRGLMAAGFEF